MANFNNKCGKSYSEHQINETMLLYNWMGAALYAGILLGFPNMLRHSGATNYLTGQWIISRTFWKSKWVGWVLYLLGGVFWPILGAVAVQALFLPFQSTPLLFATQISLTVFVGSYLFISSSWPTQKRLGVVELASKDRDE